MLEAEQPFNSDIKRGELIYYDLLQLISDDESNLLVAESYGEIIAKGCSPKQTSK